MGEPLKQLWQFIREVTGDDAYERYLAHHLAHHPEHKALTRRDYFRHRQEQKWSKVSRCC
jgi:uncharacterized short protein YbdD (DUF466 family)